MPLGISLASRVLASKTLTSWVTPVATWYANLAGYRRYGLKYDDLRMLLIPPVLHIFILSLLFTVIEESEDIQRVRLFYSLQSNGVLS